jgi:hypothetical protein
MYHALKSGPWKSSLKNLKKPKKAPHALKIYEGIG